MVPPRVLGVKVLMDYYHRSRPPYVGPRLLRMPSEPPWIGLGPPHVPFGPLTGALDLRV